MCPSVVVVTVCVELLDEMLVDVSVPDVVDVVTVVTV